MFPVYYYPAQCRGQYVDGCAQAIHSQKWDFTFMDTATLPSTRVLPFCHLSSHVGEFSSKVVTIEAAAQTLGSQGGFNPQNRKKRENKSFSKEELESQEEVQPRHLPQEHLQFLKDAFLFSSLILRIP